MAAPKSPEPNLYSYTQYRVYLKDFYDWKKAILPAFSHRYFTQKAGLGSPNYLKLVMDGKRNLSQKTLTAFLTGLGLSGKKADFFEHLVFFNQAETPAERNFHYEKLLKARAKAGLKPLEDTQFRIFSDWRTLALREMTGLKGFRKQATWIQERLVRPMTETQIDAAFALLLDAGLIRRTANGFQSVDVNITTRDEVRNLMVRNFHREMSVLASESLEKIPAQERDISSITLPLRPGDFAKVKEHLQLMRKELLNLAAEPGEGETLVQINLQCFPLTRPV
jgi:uncharacterized protein (TIGR02147 family)